MIMCICSAIWEGLSQSWVDNPCWAFISWLAAVFDLGQCEDIGLAFTALVAANLSKLPPNRLFRRCANIPADTLAWREFFQRYHNIISIAIYRIIGFPPNGRHNHLFRDVLQQFNIRLLQNNRRALLAFRGHTEGEARVYLSKIAESVAIRTLRSERTDRMLPTDFSDEPPAGSRKVRLSPLIPPDDDAVLIQHTIEHCLLKVLKGRNKYRNILIFKLYEFDSLTPAEIAEIPGLKLRSAHAVEVQISRTRKKIKKFLRENRDF